jgi:hypothetical protein
MNADEEELPDRQPTVEQVLAALSRAVRHATARSRVPVPIWALLSHLCLGRRGGPSKTARAGLDELERRGLARRTKRHGVVVWAPSEAGDARLVELDRERRAPELPESPQHRAWRRARALAEEELGRLQAELRQALLDAGRSLEARSPRPSDEWFSLAARLRTACRRVGSATYVLGEWAEPDDAHADIDGLTSPGDANLDAGELARRRALRAGRRNTRLWHDDAA